MDRCIIVAFITNQHYEKCKSCRTLLWPVPNYTNVYQSYSSKHQGIDISQGGIAGKPVVATKSGDSSCREGYM